MSKKSMKEMEVLYAKYNNFFYDLQMLKRQLNYMSKNVKGLCIEDRFSKYTSKMVDIIDECDCQRIMWQQKLQEQREKLNRIKEKESKDKGTKDK